MKKGLKIALISFFSLNGVIAILIIVFMVLITLAWTEYGSESIDKDGLCYQFSAYRKQCMVYPRDLYFNSDDDMIINIPDEINGYKVTELGGYLGKGLPCPFSVWVPLEYEIDYICHGPASDPDLTENSEIIKYQVTINLGSNIRKVYCTLSPDNYYKVLGSDTYIQMIAYFNCPEDNKYFYSVDGVLYNKSDDTPVDLY